VESLARAEGSVSSVREVCCVLRRLRPLFLLRDVHSPTKLLLLRPRYAVSYLREQMTPNELGRALGMVLLEAVA
jgi:hypothetical protein